MTWIEPKDEAQREELRKSGMQHAIYNVCWRCGTGAHQKKNLFNIGKMDGRTVYGCADHRGLIGQL